MFKLIVVSALLSSTLYARDCERSPLCDELNDLSFECSESLNESTCDKFVSVFEKAVVPGECVAFETCSLKKENPRPGIHYKLLASLPFASALKLFTSESLRKTLKGKGNADFLQKSKADEAKLGKSLVPGKIIPECRNFETLEFKSVKKDIVEKGKVTAKDYEYSEAVSDGFLIWDGDVQKKIVNTKTKKECIVKDIGLVNKITKVPGHQILRYDTYERGGGFSEEIFVDMKTCSKLWELRQGKVTVTKIRNSSWKKCGPCWNKEYRACLRIVPGHEG